MKENSKSQATATKFQNFTDQDFTWSFDSIPYTFKAGETIYLEDFKAKHFAKHLVDRELNRLNIPTNNMTKRAELESKCFPTAETVSVEKALDIEARKKEVREEPMREEEFEDLEAEPEKKKVGRPKKNK